MGKTVTQFKNEINEQLGDFSEEQDMVVYLVQRLAEEQFRNLEMLEERKNLWSEKENMYKQMIGMYQSQLEFALKLNKPEQEEKKETKISLDD